MKRTALYTLALVMILAAFIIPSCGGDDESSSNGGTGTVKVTLQDAPGEIEKLMVTIDEVTLHFVPTNGDNGEDEGVGDENDNGNNDDSSKLLEDVDGDVDDQGEESMEEEDDTYSDAGWKTIMSEPREFDLIQLKDNPTDLGLAEVPEGKVTQIRLVVSETATTTATIDGTDYDVTVPSGTIKLVSNFDIVADEELTIRLDFDAEKSLTEKGNGEYQLKPTIKILDE